MDGRFSLAVETGSFPTEQRTDCLSTRRASCRPTRFEWTGCFHWWLDERDEARQLYRDAGELKKHFNDRFWLADLSYIALGLDAEGRQIRSITSNPGHCIATGIVGDALVRKTADRLMLDDLFSGWGANAVSVASYVQPV